MLHPRPIPGQTTPGSRLIEVEYRLINIQFLLLDLHHDGQLGIGMCGAQMLHNPVPAMLFLHDLHHSRTRSRGHFPQ